MRQSPPVLYPIASLLVLVATCSRDAAETPEAPRPVRTHRVEVSGDEPIRTLAGVAQAGLEARLSFRVPGTVVELPVRLGTRVARGQVLARVDPIDYELRVEEAEAALAQAEAGLRRAEADYERVRALYENNNASKRELDAARAAAESAQAQVDALVKRLEQARQQVQYTVLRAPAAGAIAAVDIEVNENVQAGQRAFLLTGGDALEVTVGVPESLIGEMRVGQEATVRFDALPGRAFPGAVSEVGVAVTGNASTFDVTVRLEESEEAVRAGMAADVSFRLHGGGKRRIVVPLVAVGEDRSGRFVYVVEPTSAQEGVVRRRDVTVGTLEEGIEITGGLEPGELVVTAGVRRLVDGLEVRLLHGGGGDG